MGDPKADLIFGDWVYCRQHCAAHSTGWCTVSNDDKVGLDITGPDPQANYLAAVAKCRSLGFYLDIDRK